MTHVMVAETDQSEDSGAVVVTGARATWACWMGAASHCKAEGPGP